MLKVRLWRFETNQERLKRKYQRYLHKNTDGRFAVTSGSAGDPKRILYSRKRLRACKWVFSDMFARACRAFGIERTSVYVFSSFEPDESLTSLLLDEVDLPNYLSTLQAPYRVQRHPAKRALAAEYGASAVRLWIMTLANPGVLYSTNPSTLSTFFDDLAHNWRESSELIGEGQNHDLHEIAKRCDELLRAINCEYHSKRASGRLGPVDLIQTGTKEFAQRFSSHGGWESQFKFLPLCPYLVWNDTNRVS